MRPAQNPPHMATLTIATAVSVLALNMFLPSLTGIGEDFQADYGVVNLSIGGFLLVTAVLQLIFGPLSDMYGRRPIVLASTLIFALASVGCALAGTIWMFLAFRMLQAVGVAGQVVSRAAISDMYPARKAASQLGFISMAMAVAPMLGPVLGGALDIAFGWRAAFVFYAVLGFGLLVLVWRDFGETNRTPSATFGRQMKEYPELFRARRFWGYAICVSMSIGGFFAFITGAPLVATAWFGMSPALVGVGIGIITAGFMVGSFLTGRYANRLGLMPMILTGRCIALAGTTFGLLLFSLGVQHAFVFFGSAIALGFGNGLTNANALAGLMAVQPHLAGSASGLSGAMIAAVGALLTSATGAVASPDNAPFAVLAMMIAASVIALLSALYVVWVEKSEGLARTS